MARKFFDESDPRFKEVVQSPKMYERYCRMADFSKELGINDVDFITGIFVLTEENCQHFGEGSDTFVLRMIAEIKPTNAQEVLLASQMAIVYLSSLVAHKRFLDEPIPIHQEKRLQMVKVLNGIYTTQLDTLARVRRNGQQKLTIERIFSSGDRADEASLAAADGKHILELKATDRKKAPARKRKAAQSAPKRKAAARKSQAEAN